MLLYAGVFAVMPRVFTASAFRKIGHPDFPTSAKDVAVKLRIQSRETINGFIQTDPKFSFFVSLINASTILICFIASRNVNAVPGQDYSRVELQCNVLRSAISIFIASTTVSITTPVLRLDYCGTGSVRVG
jgi:hypothetical protein